MESDLLLAVLQWTISQISINSGIKLSAFLYLDFNIGGCYNNFVMVGMVFGIFGGCCGYYAIDIGFPFEISSFEVTQSFSCEVS